jgi:hypothetical protein
MFLPADVSEPLDLGRRFDLVQSLEVAEHLDASASDTFVDSLARHGDLVLFSAAIPGQGGRHHVHERWPSFWVQKFRAREFELFDIIRPRVWNDERIDWWYRQNVLLFARGVSAESLRAQEAVSMPVLDLVHPDFLSSLEEVHAPSSLSRSLARKLVPLRVRGMLRACMKRK